MLADKLKSLLADTVGLYLRSAGYHWNVEGPDFYQYHGLFGDVYEDVLGSIDDIAENIRKLSEYAPYRMERLTELVSLPEKAVSTSPKDMAEDLLSALSAYCDLLNECFDDAVQEKQQGIADFLSARIDMCQKWCWFIRTSLKS